MNIAIRGQTAPISVQLLKAFTGTVDDCGEGAVKVLTVS